MNCRSNDGSHKWKNFLVLNSSSVKKEKEKTKEQENKLVNQSEFYVYMVN